MITRLLAAVSVAVSLLVGLGSTAHAEDKRPCVSRAEWRHTPFSTQREMEARWDVRGFGIVEPAFSGPARTGVAYKACGFAMDEVALIVVYRRATGLTLAAFRFRIPGATLHGHI